MVAAARPLTWLPQYRDLAIRLEERRNQHWYNVSTGNYAALLPSVTTVLGVINKPALLPWAKGEALRRVREELERANIKDVTKVVLLGEVGDAVFRPEWIAALIDAARREPDKIKEAAAHYGTKAHNGIDALLKGKAIPPGCLEAQPAIAGFLQWQRGSGIEIVASEVPVYHPVLGYAGTVDWIGVRVGVTGWIVGDHKTSNGLWPEYGYQVAAYAKAIEQLSGIPVAECWGCRYPKAEPKLGEPPFEAKRVANIEAAWQGFLGAKQLWDAQRREMWA